MNLNFLSRRAIIEIGGTDRKKFLQGLITNDINKASATNLIYAAMLNAPGRFLYDFFIFEKGEKLMLDCLAAKREEIIKKLGFYKLRADVSITKNDELLVGQSLQNQGFPDPRSAKLGFRIYAFEQELAQKNNLLSEADYDYLRIENKIAEGETDLTSEKSLILEFDFDNINAISYEKGCYIGQELTARTHYKGEIRKKLFHVTLEQSQEKGSEISCEGKSLGIILSTIEHQKKIHALALIRLPEDQKNLEAELNSLNIKIIS